MSQANFLTLFPEQQGYQLLLVETPAARAPAVAARSRMRWRLRRRRHGHGGTARRISPGREHLPVHVPDARRARPAAWNRRPGGRAASQRARAAARAGVARRGGLSPAPFSAHGDGGERPVARWPVLRRAASRGARDRAGYCRTRRPDAAVEAAAACCSCSPCFATGLLSSVIATRAAIRGPLLESLRSE